MIDNEEISKYEDYLTMDGYDDCIVGVVEQYDRPEIVCYDKQKVLDKLTKDILKDQPSMDQNEARLEAEEFWEFNQLGSGMGEMTPCFLTLEKDLNA